MPVAAYDYGEAVNPVPFNVLGVRLKPLSLHHCLLMQAFGVGFTNEQTVPGTLEDLIFSILICSKHWSEGEFEEYIFSEQATQDIDFWVEKLGENGAEELARTLNDKIKLFNEYVKYHSQEPKFWRLEESGEESAAHWAQCVLLILTGQCGYDRPNALRCPLPQSLADYYRYAETQGIVKFMRPDEIERIEAAKNTPEPEVTYAN
jgi:hypothetical protein